LKKRGGQRAIPSPTKEAEAVVPCSNAKTIIISHETLKAQAQDADPTESLSTLVSLGKYAAAYRRLEQAQDDGGLDRISLERVLRIGKRFIKARQMLETVPADFIVNEYNKQLGLHWGMKLDGSILQIVSVKDYDVNIMKMIALDLHRTWEDRTSTNDITQEILGDPFPHDTCWRRREILRMGRKLDDVIVVNSVNALEEPLHAICSIKYTIDETATTEPHSALVPAVDSGFSRTPFAMYATSFMPLTLNGDRLRGVRKIESQETRLSPMMAKFLGLMPNSILKIMFRGGQEAMTQFTLDLLKSPESDQLLGPSPHEGFLMQVREQILASDIFV
jgi:hypothetical protein